MKRFLCAFLAVVLVLTLVPVATPQAEAAAADTIYANEAKENLNELIKALNGKYFTVDQKACAKNEPGHGCPNCGMTNVIKTDWLQSTVKRVPDSTNTGFAHYYYGDPCTKGQSCCGFANFAGWYIFSRSSSDTVKFKQLKTGKYNSTTMASAKPGDILRLGKNTSKGTHSAIFISTYDDGVVVLDCNWGISSGNCKVSKHKLAYSNYNYVTISRATNYEPDENGTYTVRLYNNYSCKNYMPTFDPENFSKTGFYSHDTSVVTVSSDSNVKRVSDCNTMKIVSKSAGSNGEDFVLATHQNGSSETGYYPTEQEMTLSFWAKASKDGAKIKFRWGRDDTYKSVTLSTEWEYYTLRIDHPYVANHAIVAYVNSECTAWLSEMQLEDGTEATAYVAENSGLYSSFKAKYGETYSGLTTPSRDGYIFDGWYTKSSGGKHITTKTSVLTGDIRLFAHWYSVNHTHSYTKEVTTPTDKKMGYTTYTCSECGHSYKANYTLAAPTISISRSSGKPKISWSAIGGATKYYIYRSTDGNTYEYYTSTTKTSFTNSKASSGTKYYYKVKAVAVVNDKNIYSAYSNVKSMVTTLTAPTVSITTSSGHPKLIWKAITGADTYIVYYSTDGKSYSKLTTTTKLTYTHTKAKAGKTYYYKVKAVTDQSSYATSAYSKAVSVKAK